jgi:redox-sensitive bicupin YhaK (pirin superfamily)
MPRYREIKSETIPSVKADGSTVRLVAGTFRGIRGPATEITAQPQYMDVTLEPGAEFMHEIPEGHTAVAYLFDGYGIYGADQAEAIEAYSLIVFGDGDHVRILGGSDSGARFMLIAGAPFGEPVVPYGPFVMNTEEEIEQALDDIRNGTFVMQP